MILKQWWNGTERENPISRKKPLPRPFLHRKSYMNWFGIEPLPPRLDDVGPWKGPTSVKSVVRFSGREQTVVRQVMGSDQRLFIGGNNELFFSGVKQPRR
jgi:hypothetical protein